MYDLMSVRQEDGDIYDGMSGRQNGWQVKKPPADSRASRFHDTRLMLQAGLAGHRGCRGGPSVAPNTI